MAQHSSTQSEQTAMSVPASCKKFFSRCSVRMSWYAPVSIILLVLVLIPLLAISPYNHSYADDWHYGVWSHLALQHSGSILSAIAEGFRQVGVAWFGWQGTYSAILLMALQPGVFGEKYYVLAAPLVLIVLLSGLFYLAKVLLRDVLGLPHRVWVSVASVAACVMLLLQPSPVEGIFWYNSAMYYSGFNAFGFFLAGQLITTLRQRTQLTRKKLIIRTVVSCLLAAWFAGGNFVSLLVGVELGLGVCLYLYATRQDSKLLVLTPAVALMLVGAILSFVAPGNAVRQATQFADDKLGVAQTISASVAAGFKFLSEWSGGLMLLGILFVIPLFASALVSCAKWDKRRFSHPVLATFCAVALFASSFTPTFYSMGTVGPGRVQDCRYEIFVVLAFVVALWWCGWVLEQAAAYIRTRAARHELPDAGDMSDARVSLAGSVEGVTAEKNYAHDLRNHAYRAASATSALVLAISLMFVWSATTSDETRETLSSLSAAHSLVTGQAQAYDQQVWRRLDFLATTDQKNVTVPFYTNVPHVLLMGDIRDNMNNYINYRLAQWFELDKIIAVHPQEGSDGFGPLAPTKL